jgi:hypothetical protein
VASPKPATPASPQPASSASAASPAADSAAPAAPLEALLPFAVSITAVPLMVALSEVPALREDSTLLFLVGVAVIAVAVALPRALLGSRATPFFSLSVLFAFTSIVDAVLAAAAFGLTSAGAFYLHSGERYLRASHGGFINAWDATAHYLCYLFFASTIRRGAESSRLFAPLVWCWAGSVLGSLAVLLPAVALGRYGLEVKPSILLNVPYIAVPLAFMRMAETRAPRTYSQ